MFHVSNKCMLGVALCHLLVAARPESLAVIVTSPSRAHGTFVGRGLACHVDVCKQAHYHGTSRASPMFIYLSSLAFARRALASSEFARILHSRSL